MKDWYSRHYKKLMIIPLILLFVSILQIAWQISTTGDFINKGVALKGGSIISITSDLPAMLEEELLQEFPDSQLSIRPIKGSTGFVIESNLQSQESIDNVLQLIKNNYLLSTDQISVEITGASLGNSFFRQMFGALGFAFVIMGIVVFLYFRTFIPSFAVIFAAFANLVTVIALFNLTSMPLTTGGIAALLMLIGYSVDTDILLTSRMLKGHNKYSDFIGAVKTGTLMSATTLVAIGIALLLAQNEVLIQIMLIIFMGLIVDMIYTWLFNAGILRWYLDRRGAQ